MWLLAPLERYVDVLVLEITEYVALYFSLTYCRDEQPLASNVRLAA